MVLAAGRAKGSTGEWSPLGEAVFMMGRRNRFGKQKVVQVELSSFPIPTFSRQIYWLTPPGGDNLSSADVASSHLD
jgi:hypothetical protein